MLKRYFIAIFLLSALSLHGMDEERETSSDPRIKVGQSADGKAIVAEHVIASWDGETLYHTTVTKYLATGCFEVKADFASPFARAHIFIPPNFEQETEDTLKFKIAEFEKQKQ
jgi:hypothetical protein